jgi:hypothetical protein
MPMKEETTICFRIPNHERRHLEALADSEHRTISDQIRHLIATAKKTPVKIERESCDCNNAKQKGKRRAVKSVYET